MKYRGKAQGHNFIQGGAARRAAALLLLVALALAWAAPAVAADVPPLNLDQLSRGSYGHQVYSLQQVLQRLGLYKGTVDSLYDAATIAGVRALQQRLGVTADGVYGPKTQAAYNAALAAGKLEALIAAGAPAPSSVAGKVIGIDPGHQERHDDALEAVAPGSARTKARMSRGAVGVKSNMPEYKITLLVAQQLQQLLEAAGAKVVLTRSEHAVNLSNRERALLMNDAQVDVWVRLHCDAAASPQMSGARALVPSRSANSSIYKESLALSKTLLAAFCEATQAKKRTIVARHDQTGFNWSASPVVAVEMGYLSNVNDDTKLNRSSYQALCAQGLFQGLEAYFTSKK